MNSTLASTQQIGVSLCLVVATKKDNDPTRLNFAHLADLAPILFWLMSLNGRVNRLITSAARLAARLVFAFEESWYAVITWLAEPIETTWLKTWSKTWSKTWLKTPRGSFLADRGRCKSPLGF